MAGIGFELKKLFQKRGVLAMVRAYGYAGMICTGPMLLGILLILGIMLISREFGAVKPDRDLMVCMITYALLSSLKVTSFFSMVTTRFIADKFYEEKLDQVMPSLYGSCSIMMVLGGLAYAIFLYFSGITPGMQLLNLLLFEELLVVWSEINYLTAIKDYRGILLTFGLSLLVAFLAALLLLTLHVEVKLALLSAVCLGYGIMVIWYLILLLKYFPRGKGSIFSFLRWFDLYKPLAFTGLALDIGLFAHLLVAWASTIGQRVHGLFYGAPEHDVPALFAFLTILITTVNFVTSIEVNFYPKYKDYYSQFNGNGSIKDIHQSEHEMLTVLEHELLYTARKQLYTTALAVSVGVLFIHMLPLGFTDEMDTYFRVLCIGYGMYALANMMLLILLYFTDYRGAMWSAVTFAATSTVASVILAGIDERYIGFGFMIGSGLFCFIVIVRLGFFTKKLPFHILSTQPVVAQRTTGVFHVLCDWLERRQTRETIQKKKA